jgi:hypothetical protein
MEAEMKHAVTLLLAGLAAGCMAQETVELSPAAQTQLAEALEGRTAGPAVSCVSQRELRNNRTIGDDFILFDGPNDILYLNRPAGGCPTLELGRALRTRTTSSQLCRGDIVTVFDPVSGAEYGGCGLGDFVPYRRMR